MVPLPHILVVDDSAGPTLLPAPIFSEFASDCHVSIVAESVSAPDQPHLRPISHPLNNGLLELEVLKLNQLKRIDAIYTRQEDLVLRVARLREHLNVPGLFFHDALIFRDKLIMKARAKEHGFPVPEFTGVQTPVDVLTFVENHGLPVIVKPRLGAASAGITVLKTMQDVQRFLEKDFFSNLDNDGHFDHDGNLIMEQFIEAPMFHVNGYAKDGKLVYVWPFQYLQTNLSFTKGSPYGNLSIPPSDALYDPLITSTQRLLDAFPKLNHLFFHLELFQVNGEFMLCEIAARRPGGSIPLLMDLIEGGNFQELEFRCHSGLLPRYPVSDQAQMKKGNEKVVGDLIIPLKIGRLVAIPSKEEFPSTIQGIQYRPVAKAGTVYKGFSVQTLNTCARFVATDFASMAEAQKSLNQALEWFNSNVVYESPTHERLMAC
jgi:biotin carboxylase